MLQAAQFQNAACVSESDDGITHTIDCSDDALKVACGKKDVPPQFHLTGCGGSLIERT